MDLIALAYFNAVAAHGSFGRASKVTGTPKATLSRRVRALEDQLGLRLFERGTRSIRLTEEGQQLRSRTEHLISDLNEAGEELVGSRGRPHGRLRISVPVLFADREMTKIVAAFHAKYPEVLLEITVDDRYVDAVAEGYDLVIRVNPKAQEGMAGKRIKRDRLVVAGPRGMPIVADRPVPAIALLNAKDSPRWKTDNVVVQPRIVTRCSSMALVLRLVSAGVGVAVMPKGLVDDSMVIWGVLESFAEAWVLHPSRRLESAKVRAFIEVLETC